jgi:hypothetical protein
VKVFRDNHEFIAAQPRDEVGLPNTAGEPLRDLLQQAVAGVVAKCVIDLLEAVQIDEQHRQPFFRPLRTRNRVRETLFEGLAIRQTGQQVVAGEVVQFSFGFLAL